MSTLQAINPLLPRQPSSDHPSRPIPKKTYGRRPKDASPPIDNAFLFTSDPVASSSQLSSPPPSTEASLTPRKARENRFFKGHSEWRSKLDGMQPGAVSAPTRKEPEEDPTELNESMKLFKHRANQAILAKKSGSATPATMTVPIPSRPSLFGSSSLTEIPPARSTPPSSPPPRSPVVLPISIHTSSNRVSADLEDDETFPVKKAGPSKGVARRRVVASSDEEEDQIASPSKNTPRLSHKPIPTSIFPPKSRSITPVTESETGAAIDKSPPRKSRTPTPATDNREVGTPRQSILAKALFSSPGANSEGDAETLDPPSPEESGDAIVESPPKAKETAEQMIARMFGETDERDGSPAIEPVEGIDDAAGPYSSGDDEGPVARSKKLKPLNKKDMEKTKSDMQRAARDRELRFDRPPQKVITGYWDDLKKMYGTQTSISPTMVEPADPIEAFPSSREKGIDRNYISPPPTIRRPVSSPTRVSMKQPSVLADRTPVIPALRDDSDDEPETQYKSILEEMEEREGKEAAQRAAEAKRRAFAQFKAQNLKAQSAKPRHVTVISDDGLEVEGAPVKAKPKAATIVRRTKGPSADAIHHRDPKKVPVNTRRMNQISNLSGKTLRKEEEFSETHVDHAGTTWGHSGTRAANAGSKPHGQKEGRDRPMSAAAMDLVLTARAAQQVDAVRESKEKNFGRKGAMPAKKALDLDKIAKRAAEQNARKEEMEDDDDPEDGDYAAEVEEAESGEEAEDEAEAEEATDIDEESAVPVPKTSPLLEDEDEDETMSPIKIKSRRRARITTGSDDEDMPEINANLGEGSMAAGLARAPLAEIDTGGFDNEIDMGGFGEDEGGFSQLFAQTQKVAGVGVPTKAVLNNGVEIDVFADMRPDPLALRNAHAILPQNYVSETQAKRDDALVGAEIEAAMEPVRRSSTQKPQYLNDAGFFTQTKPATQYATQNLGSLAGSSMLMDARLDSSSSGDDEDDPMNEDDENVDGTPSESHRRRLAPKYDDKTAQPYNFDPTQISPQKLSSPPKNAFSFLMDKSRKPKSYKPLAPESDFIEGQAEESDEDNGWGAGGGGGDDDDEEGGADAYAEGVVDDALVDPEERAKQDALAEEKRREIEKEDDAKREEEARKVTEGQYRTKRKGKDFIDSDEEDDGPRRRRLNKRQRKMRKEEGKDGISRLPGERNVFEEQYENDEDSDPDDDALEEAEETPIERSPGVKLSYVQRMEMLHKVGQANKRVDQEDIWDGELGLGGRRDTYMDEDDDLEVVDKPFTVTKIQRTTSLHNVDDSQSQNSQSQRSNSLRTTESYSQYVADVSQNNRRDVAVNAGVSIHGMKTTSIPQPKLSKGDQKYGGRRGIPQKKESKLLGSKTRSFAS